MVGGFGVDYWRGRVFELSCKLEAAREAELSAYRQAELAVEHLHSMMRTRISAAGELCEAKRLLEDASGV